jgi:hypothetical protein
VVHENIKILKTHLPQAKFVSHFVVQFLNLQYMLPTVDYLNQLIMPVNLVNLISPDWLSWSVLTKTEINALISHLNSQVLTYKLTSKQKNQISYYVSTLEHTETNFDLREKFVSNMSSIMKLRKIDQSTIANHFGVLSSLADEICK